MEANENSIHLLEKLNNFTRLGPSEYESSWWKVSEAQAEKLRGGRILFHKEKRKPSFYGGIILGYRIEEQGEYVGRIIFRFEYNEHCRGVSAGPGNWTTMEKKIVIQE